MSIPGLMNVLGVGAALLYQALDPRRKKERLYEARKRIVQEPATPGRAQRLAVIDAELQAVQREIERRVS